MQEKSARNLRYCKIVVFLGFSLLIKYSVMSEDLQVDQGQLPADPPPPPPGGGKK